MRECMCLCERAREREKEWMKRVRNRLGNEGERDRVHRNDSCSFSSFLLHKSFFNRVILTHKSFKSISGRYPLKRFSGKLNKPFQKKQKTTSSWLPVQSTFFMRIFRSSKIEAHRLLVLSYHSFGIFVH